jgi:hypothetical protein
MVKKDPLKKLVIATPGKITVNSKTYGRHERAPRGSKTKIEVNEAMKEAGRRLAGANIQAKLICDALKPFRENFQGGQIWQRLVKHFALQAKKHEDYSVIGIKEWDLNQQYPTSRLMYPTVEFDLDPLRSELHISVSYFFNDRFLERKNNITDFRITIILLFPDFIKNEIITIASTLPEKKMEDSAKYEFIQLIPEGAGSWLGCFKAEASVLGVPVPGSGNVDKAMCLLEGGIIG